MAPMIKMERLEAGGKARAFSSYLLLSSLEWSDAKVYEPSIRARLGTAAHFCEVVVLKLRQVVKREPLPNEAGTT